MCCFGIRVFLLISATLMSVFLHGVFPKIPVILFYGVFANFISFVIFLLFFLGKLPKFVKQNAVHYFSFIGGFLSGLLLSLLNIKKIEPKFFKIELFITLFWLIAIALLVLNFSFISNFFAGFLNG